MHHATTCCSNKNYSCGIRGVLGLVLMHEMSAVKLLQVPKQSPVVLSCKPTYQQPTEPLNQQQQQQQQMNSSAADHLADSWADLSMTRLQAVTHQDQKSLTHHCLSSRSVVLTVQRVLCLSMLQPGLWTSAMTAAVTLISHWQPRDVGPGHCSATHSQTTGTSSQVQLAAQSTPTVMLL